MKKSGLFALPASFMAGGASFGQNLIRNIEKEEVNNLFVAVKRTYAEMVNPGSGYAIEGRVYGLNKRPAIGRNGDN